MFFLNPIKTTTFNSIKRIKLTNPSTSTIASTSSSRSICSCQILRGTPGLQRLNFTEKKPRSYIKKTIKPLSKTLPQTELFLQLNEILPLVNRPTIINENTAREIVRGWGIDKLKDCVVIDAYAGPGGITRALLELPNVKRVIAIEEAYRYIPKLKAIQDLPQNKGRLEIITSDPFIWETYTDIQKLGLLDDVPKVPWNQVHPSFFLCGQLPNTRHGEQLFLQFLTTSAGQMWLYQFGRFELGFLGNDSYWSKLQAQPNTSGHHKLSVLVQSLSNINRVRTLTGLQPPELHFHKPKKETSTSTSNSTSSASANNYQAVKVSLKENTGITSWDTFEFVARHMFIGKAMPWTKAVTALAAGAGNLIPKMIAKGLPAESEGVKVNQLELHHWIAIAEVFDKWAFKPATMFDDLAFNSE